MHKKGIEGFPYYLGIRSLADIATREDRVVVLNAMGGESREVTPTSHAFSGGNVVYGVSPGRRGQSLATPVGKIPIYNNIREGLDDGHSFNTGVVYLPPGGVRDGVAELVRVNPDLQKIVIITEKIAIHDAREVRAMCQANGIDVIGGNCLGVADSWNRVRIGGALGGDHPEESLLKGSISIFSNSGGFTTTIAQYLATAGWGTTTLISSGKDVYIHYAARDFVYALANDDRSQAAVLYSEPGGYYEYDLNFTKPIVACIVGRWKSKLTRAVGHAGAMAGSGDRAEDKENWFMNAPDVSGVFTPEDPSHFTAKGAVVTNIADIPTALTAVMKLNGRAPDFAPRGDLGLKPWIANNQGLKLLANLQMAAVASPEPYSGQNWTGGSRLRNSITFRLFAVVGIVLLIGTSGVTFLADRYRFRASERAFDMLLAGAALDISRSIEVSGDQTTVDIPLSAFELLDLAPEDRIIYAVFRPDGVLVTGYPELAAELSGTGKRSFSYTRIGGEQYRIVVLPRSFAERSFSGNVTVIVGHTMLARTALTQEIVSQAMIVLAAAGAAILAMTILAVWFSLLPLRRIERALRLRDPKDLRPIEVDVPIEISANARAINSSWAGCRTVLTRCRP